MNFSSVLSIIKGAPAIVAQAPAFKALFDQVLTVFKPGEQQQLKDAYAEARQRSDDAQDEFTDASRGR
jgi:hypothetical protein